MIRLYSKKRLKFKNFSWYFNFFQVQGYDCPIGDFNLCIGVNYTAGVKYFIVLIFIYNKERLLNSV